MPMITEALKNPVVYNHVRSDIRQDIQKYYVGKSRGNIGLGGFNIVDGKIQTFNFRRSDIFLVQYWEQVNVFVEADGSFKAEPWEGVTLTDFDRKSISTYVKVLLSENKQYVEQEKRYKDWFDSYHEMLDGQSPEYAVRILKHAGF